VILPTCDEVRKISKTGNIGLLATESTVNSNFYKENLSDMKVNQMPCSHWVNLIEDLSYNTTEGLSIIRNDLNEFLEKNSDIDTLILGCTHFGILEDIVNDETPKFVKIINQGKVMSKVLPQIIGQSSNNGTTKYYTTESSKEFDEEYKILFGGTIKSETVYLT